MVGANAITHKTGTKSILDLRNLYNHGHLNLGPGFQRQSVWKPADRALLIDSLLRNFPLPAIFLYKREDKGELIFDVIDGKQRLESILMFTGAMRGRFSARAHLSGAETEEAVNWALLKRRGLHHLRHHQALYPHQFDWQGTDRPGETKCKILQQSLSQGGCAPCQPLRALLPREQNLQPWSTEPNEAR